MRTKWDYALCQEMLVFKIAEESRPPAKWKQKKRASAEALAQSPKDQKRSLFMHSVHFFIVVVEQTLNVKKLVFSKSYLFKDNAE